MGGTAEEPSVYEDNFDEYLWIDDANLTGFLDVKLTSLPKEEPGFLLAKTRSERPVDATLTYRFESYFPLDSVEMELIGAAPIAAKAVNELALLLNEQDWPVVVKQSGNDEMQSLALRAQEEVKGSRVFYLRVQMRNDARAIGIRANRLDRLVVRCIH